MLCLKRRRTYSFTQGACSDLPRRSKKDDEYNNESLSLAVTTLPRNHKSREDRSSRMGLTVTEDTPADMLTGSMELLVQLPRDHHTHTQRVTVPRSTPMMDLLVQVATAHKLAASSYTLQAIGDRGLILSHHPNTPIGALDALQVKLLPKQGTFMPRKAKQANQPFETTFRLQVHLPRNQLYVSRVSPKMNLGDILDEVCREKGLDRSKYELRHPANVEEVLDPSLSLQDYHLQEVTLCPKLRSLGSALSSQDIMALQRQEERRRQQAKQGVFGFMFKKSKESSLSTDSLGGRSVSPARSDETGRSASPQQPPPARPQRKRRPAPKPPAPEKEVITEDSKEKIVISHSRNSSDSSGYHEASVLSDNPDSGSRVPETLPRRSKLPTTIESPRKLSQTSQASKSLGNLAAMSTGMTHAASNSSLSSAGLRKKKAAPLPPKARPLSSAISTQGLERIVDSEESLTSDMDLSKPSSDIAASSKANSDIGVTFNANSDIGVNSIGSKLGSDVDYKLGSEIGAATKSISKSGKVDSKVNSKVNSRADSEIQSTDIGILKQKSEDETSRQDAPKVEPARVEKRAGSPVPIPKPRIASSWTSNASSFPEIPKRRSKAPVPLAKPRTLSKSIDDSNNLEDESDFAKYTRPTSDVCRLNDTKNVSNGDHNGQSTPPEKVLESVGSSMEKLVENDPVVQMKDISTLNFNTRPRSLTLNPTLSFEETRPSSSVQSSSKQVLETSPTNDSEPIISKTMKKNEDIEIESKKDIGSVASRGRCLNTGDNDARLLSKKRHGKKIPEKPRRKSLENAGSANVKKETDETENAHNEQKVQKSKSCDFGHVLGVQDANAGRTVVEPTAQRSAATIETSGAKLRVISNNVKSRSSVKAIYDKLTATKDPLKATKGVEVPSDSKDNNIVLQGKSSDHLFKKSPNVVKTSTSKGSLKPARSMNDIYSAQQREDNSTVPNPMTSIENRRSCAVISTIPKCDRFELKEVDIDVDKIIQQIVETVDRESKKSTKVRQKYETIRNKGSLGSSFGAGKSILGYEQDSEGQKKSEAHSEDELQELENLEMFERIKSIPKRSKILRSHSEMNSFEINGLQKHARSLTCQSEDFTFAINPNFSPERLTKRIHSDGQLVKSLPKGAGDASLNSLQPSAELPAFLRRSTNLGHWKNLENSEDDDKPATWNLGESGTDGLSETDILLRKVSDTLSGSLTPPSLSPPSPPPSKRSSLNIQESPSNANPTESLLSKATESLSQTLESIKKVEANVQAEQIRNKHLNVSPDETILRSSTPTMTIGSGQDTSDYVSATGEDLSISDWEYQLPAPPSAFRDADSPDIRGYETITLGSVEAFKEPSIARIVDQPAAKAASHDDTQSLKKPVMINARPNPEPKLKPEPQVEVTPPTPMEKRSYDRQISNDSLASDNLELKKEIISELENRIENGRLSRSSSKAGDPDSRRPSDISSTPSIAPVDNTLSNFTITTYSRQKSLDIFDEVEDHQSGAPGKNQSETVPGRMTVSQDDYNSRKNSETLKIAATLERNRTISETSNGSVSSRKSSASLDREFAFRKNTNSSVQSSERNLTDDAEFKKPAPKIFKQHESLSRRQSFKNDNEKTTNVHRSKSYISLGNNSRYRNDSIGENGRTKSITSLNSEDDDSGMKKSDSVSSLNQEAPRNNEKFSQWRDKFLKRQEEPTKEKQLQSLQVLKSILPQLKSTQQAEENVYEQSDGKHSDENRSRTLPIESSAEEPIVSTIVKPQSKSEAGPEPQKLKSEEPNIKRYSYAGPPAINLGSWSERPRVNVQIKMDTDYKFGKNNTSGAKTVVNLNGSVDESDHLKNNGLATSQANEVKRNLMKDEMKPEVRQPERKEPDELTKKLISHTTAIGFKRPVLNKVGFQDVKVQSKTEGKPVVAAVELKKTLVERQESQKKQEEDEEIDTKPINFRELTKAFGQEVILRGKPKYATQNRHSEYYSVKPEVAQKCTKTDVNQNGYVSLNIVAKQTEPVRNGHVLSNGIVQNGSQNSPVKRYTSVVGINSQNSNFGAQNGDFSMKNNTNLIKVNGGPMPVVKGFKVQATKVETSQNGFGPKKHFEPPKAPTMPVITGVTLKSANARPKSMPIQAEPRDQLLESIRNFGGRNMLKGAAERY